MYRLAGYLPALPGYYTCYTLGIISHVDVNKDLILETPLFIYREQM